MPKHNSIRIGQYSITTTLNVNKDDDIEVISTQDERAKIIGEILSNNTSRAILNLLKDEELTLNEIAQKTDSSCSLVTHHLKRMQSSKMIKISRVGRSVKNHKMNYYTAMNRSYLIVPTKAEKTITGSAKKFSRFVAIGLAGLVSWFVAGPDLELSTRSGDLSVDSDGDVKQPSDTESLEVVPGFKPEHSIVHDFSDSAGERHVDSDNIALEGYHAIESQIASINADLIFSITVPIAVVIAGIILERTLVRWHTSRRRIEKLSDIRKRKVKINEDLP